MSEIQIAIMNLIVAEVPTEETSCYGIATVLNRIVKANGSGKSVRPQMMYNYARNGMIVRGEKIFGETLRTFTKIEVAEFVMKYCSRNELEIRFNTPVSKDQLELDLQI